MNYARFVLGTLLIVVGGVYMFEYFGWIDDAGGIVADWWPLALIFVAVMLFAANPRHWMTPLIVALVGGLVLLNTTGVADTEVNVAWPVLIIALGLMVLFGRRGAHSSSDDRISAFTAFGGTQVASHSKHFEGGNIGAIFGGAEIDLTDATLTDGASLDVFTAFGGTELKVPQGWKVVTHSLPLFGGVENVTHKEHLDPDAPTLDVSATVVFGGLEVKH